MFSILVPLDGSSAASAALPHAVGLANRFGAELWLSTVCDPGEAPTETTGQKWEFLNAMGRRLQARTRILEGKPSEELVREAHYMDPDLIVMGTRPGRGTGTVTEFVMRNAPGPVLIVRDVEPEANERRLEAALRGDYPRYGRILLPLDGSPVAEQSLGPACQLAHRDQAVLTLVRVLECADRPGRKVEFDETHRAYLEERAAGLRERGCRVKTRYCHGAFGQRLADLEEDLIVLTASAHPLVGGSNIADVVYQAVCPVLVVKGQRNPLFERAMPEASGASA